jgi:acyl carrier protein
MTGYKLRILEIGDHHHPTFPARTVVKRGPIIPSYRQNNPAPGLMTSRTVTRRSSLALALSLVDISESTQSRADPSLNARASTFDPWNRSIAPRIAWATPQQLPCSEGVDTILGTPQASIAGSIKHAARRSCARLSLAYSPWQTRASLRGVAELLDFFGAIEGQCGLPAPLESGDVTSRLVEDLGLDSLNLLELVVLIEQLAGTTSANISLDFPLLESLGDTFQYFEQLSDWLPEHKVTKVGLADEQCS